MYGKKILITAKQNFLWSDNTNKLVAENVIQHWFLRMHLRNVQNVTPMSINKPLDRIAENVTTLNLGW